MAGAATLVAITLALYDMDRVGHGKFSFVHKPVGSPGSVTSWGDATLLGCIVATGVIAWVLSGRA